MESIDMLESVLTISFSLCVMIIGIRASLRVAVPLLCEIFHECAIEKEANDKMARAIKERERQEKLEQRENKKRKKRRSIQISINIQNEWSDEK